MAGLADIPFYSAYAQRKQQIEAEPMQQLQQASAAVNLGQAIQSAQASDQLKGLLAETGGDAEKAMAAAIKSGNIAAAQHLAPIVKIQQEQRMREETPRLLASINAPQAAAPAVAPVAPDIPTASPSDAMVNAPTPASPAPQDAAAARISQLQKMLLIPQYANNPVVAQRLTAEIDRLQNQKPIIEQNFPVGDNKVQPHLSYDNGKTWTPLPGSQPTSKFANVQPVAGNFSLKGEDFLNTLPPSDRNFIKKLANYEIDPRTLSTRGGNRERALSMAAQYNPDFDQKNYNMIANAVTRFGTGPQGNTVRSLNVAVEHMDTARRLAAAMQNGDIPLINQLKNEIATQTGQPAPSNFNAVKEILADEVIKGVIGGTGALQDREAAAKKIRDAASPAQLNGVLDSWTELLGGQLKGLEKQYQGATMGRKDFRDRFLTPRARQAIESVSGGAVSTQGATPPPPPGFVLDK